MREAALTGQALRAVYLFHVLNGCIKRAMIARKGLEPFRGTREAGISVYGLCHHYYNHGFGFGFGGWGLEGFGFSIFYFPLSIFHFHFHFEFPFLFCSLDSPFLIFRFAPTSPRRLSFLPFAYFCHLPVVCKSI